MVDITQAYALFPHVPKKALNHPQGEVAMLIGQENASLLPTGGTGPNIVGNLRDFQSPLGTGWVLGGTHPLLGLNNKLTSINPRANIIKAATILPTKSTRVNLLRCPSFPELDDLSIAVPCHPLC